MCHHLFHPFLRIEAIRDNPEPEIMLSPLKGQQKKKWKTSYIFIIL